MGLNIHTSHRMLFFIPAITYLVLVYLCAVWPAMAEMEAMEAIPKPIEDELPALGRLTPIGGAGGEHLRLWAMLQQGLACLDGRRCNRRLEAPVARRCRITGPHVDPTKGPPAVQFPGGPGQLGHVGAGHLSQAEAVGPGEHRFQIEIGDEAMILGQLQREEAWPGESGPKRRPTASKLTFDGPFGADLRRQKHELGAIGHEGSLV